MHKVVLLLAIVVAAATPSLAFAGKVHRHHAKPVAAQPRVNGRVHKEDDVETLVRVVTDQVMAALGARA